MCYPPAPANPCLLPQLVLLAVVGCAWAAPQVDPNNRDAVAEVILDERTDNGDGAPVYRFETTNQIAEQREGFVGSAGQSNYQGAIQ